MRSYQAEGSRLLDMMRVVHMLTAKGSRLIPDDYPLREGDLSSLLEQTSKLKIRWERENLGVGMVALPHGPMATLTRETMNLGALVRHGQARWKKAAVKHVDEFVIVGDQRLVAREDGSEEVYIQVPLGGSDGAGQGEVVPEVADGQVIAALTQALMRMCRDHSPMLSAPGEGVGADAGSGQLELLGDGDASLAGLVEEILRGVAGIFRAARVDRGLSFVGSGEFVDSTTATRLTDIIGLSGKTTRSRNRVAAVRAMLENVRLKRTVRSEDGKSLVTWEGPIIQRLKDRIDVETKLPRDYGLTSRHELGLWRIAPELWRMQDADGKAASFMLLDERAFSLSGLSPDPFNLYWTIIQRAYNAHRAKSEDDKFDDSGSFRPTLSVLYTWAGMDKKTDAKNMARARERMDGHLKSMRERELIVSYDADVFSPTRGLSLASSTRIDIQLPPSLLCFLPNAAFRSGNNPFGRGRPALN